MDATQAQQPGARRPLIGMSARRWSARTLGENVGPAMRDAEVDIHFADYPRAIAAAGGLPVGLCPDAEVDSVLDRIDGLVLTGGADIDPELYGEAIEPGCGAIERERDLWELALLRGAIERSMPVFGICRGLQLANVAYGGTLVQHLAPDAGDGHARFDRPRAEVAHAVKLEPGSLAHSVYGTTLEVNSLHHQVVDRLGTGLAVSGRSPDGIVEAVEGLDAAVLAVQWHPEASLDRQPDPGLRWLVRAAASRVPLI